MKAFIFILGLVVAAICGYSFEPQLSLRLTGKPRSKPPVEITDKPPVKEPADSDVAAKPVIDLTKISLSQLPAKVVLKTEAELVDGASDLKVKVSAGSQINLIRLEGSNVIISPGAGSFEGKVPIEQTDLMEQLLVLQKTPLTADPELVPEVPVATPPPEPTPEPVPTPEPTPEPTPTPAPAPAPVASGDPVVIMKGSIQAGEIKEFTFNQVLKWQPGEESEMIDGESYQTGIAFYKAETVFGVKTIQAKALIQDGEVVRWLWPKSGMEIK